MGSYWLRRLDGTPTGCQRAAANGFAARTINSGRATGLRLTRFCAQLGELPTDRAGLGVAHDVGIAFALQRLLYLGDVGVQTRGRQFECALDDGSLKTHLAAPVSSPGGGSGHTQAPTLTCHPVGPSWQATATNANGLIWFTRAGLADRVGDAVWRRPLGHSRWRTLDPETRALSASYPSSRRPEGKSTANRRTAKVKSHPSIQAEPGHRSALAPDEPRCAGFAGHGVQESGSTPPCRNQTLDGMVAPRFLDPEIGSHSCRSKVLGARPETSPIGQRLLGARESAFGALYHLGKTSQRPPIPIVPRPGFPIGRSGPGGQESALHARDS